MDIGLRPIVVEVIVLETGALVSGAASASASRSSPRRFRRQVKILRWKRRDVEQLLLIAGGTDATERIRRCNVRPRSHRSRYRWQIPVERRRFLMIRFAIDWFFVHGLRFVDGLIDVWLLEYEVAVFLVVVGDHVGFERFLSERFCAAARRRGVEVVVELSQLLAFPARRLRESDFQTAVVHHFGMCRRVNGRRH